MHSIDSSANVFEKSLMSDLRPRQLSRRLCAEYVTELRPARCLLHRAT
jgi:hypothetical protein